MSRGKDDVTGGGIDMPWCAPMPALRCSGLLKTRWLHPGYTVAREIFHVPAGHYGVPDYGDL